MSDTHQILPRMMSRPLPTPPGQDPSVVQAPLKVPDSVSRIVGKCVDNDDGESFGTYVGVCRFYTIGYCSHGYGIS